MTEALPCGPNAMMIPSAKEVGAGSIWGQISLGDLYAMVSLTRRGSLALEFLGYIICAHAIEYMSRSYHSSLPVHRECGMKKSSNTQK